MFAQNEIGRYQQHLVVPQKAVAKVFTIGHLQEREAGCDAWTTEGPTERATGGRNLFVHSSVYPPDCPCVCLPLCGYLSVYLSIDLPTCLSLSFCLAIK